MKSDIGKREKAAYLLASDGHHRFLYRTASGAYFLVTEGMQGKERVRLEPVSDDAANELYDGSLWDHADGRGMMEAPSTMSSASPSLEGLGAFIRHRRHILGLTQTQLGERLRWVQERISILENGKYGMPSLPALARLAAALDASLSEVLQAAGYTGSGEPASTDAEAGEQDNLALLYTLRRLLSIEAISVNDALDQASDQLAEVMSVDKIDVFLHDPGTRTLVALGTSTTPMGRQQHQIGMNRLPIVNGGREVEVFETGEPYHTGDAQHDPEMLVGTTEGLGVQSALIVPLDVAGTRRGVLVAESSRADGFSAQDLPFLETVARWVGIVVHRAELVERMTTDEGDGHTPRKGSGANIDILQ